MKTKLDMDSCSDAPLASIIISIYRRDTFLHQAIQSALSQTWPQVEILIAEDGGSDCARNIISNFNESSSRLRLLSHPSNIGAAANKLHAWQEAKGDFLVNLDDDDLLEPGFIAALLPPLQKDLSLVLSFCDHFLIDEQGEVKQPETDDNTKAWKRNILKSGVHRPFLKMGLVDQSIPFAMGTMWCKSRLNLDDFKIQSGPSYDLFMTYVAAKTGLGAYYIPERLAKYRVHPGMETTMGRERIHRANIFCNRQYLKDPALKPWRSIFLNRLTEAYTGLGIVTLREHRRGLAMKCYLQSLLAQPTRRAMAGLIYCLHPHGPAKVY